MERYTRISERWEELEPVRKKISELEDEIEQLREIIAKYQQTDKDYLIINTIQRLVRSNVLELGLFKGNKGLINNIKVDETDNYTPYLDNFDIYNISSSSDNIRIILSYYLALLQTSIKLDHINEINFPRLLILDEPKQQNLDSDSLMDCVNLVEDITSKT